MHNKEKKTTKKTLPFVIYDGYNSNKDEIFVSRDLNASKQMRILIYIRCIKSISKSRVDQRDLNLTVDE